MSNSRATGSLPRAMWLVVPSHSLPAGTVSYASNGKPAAGTGEKEREGTRTPVWLETKRAAAPFKSVAALSGNGHSSPQSSSHEEEHQKLAAKSDVNKQEAKLDVNKQEGKTFFKWLSLSTDAMIGLELIGGGRRLSGFLRSRDHEHT